ncbi:hypothetical protein COCON_G00222840 [Conger conger]|uniref:Transcription elongation regulator 1-like protein n=1 Tax=Conger conger TaxID=82655 RepID=A0A9Q1CWR8_CONCO|nr:hypothetical protein COCON_G00222840 [Conger conger]
MGATPPPVLISSHPPPVLLAASGWRLTCEPLLPLMPVPFKPEPAVHQWELHSQTPDRTVQSAAGLDLVPVFPHAYGSVLPPAFGKRWVEKRIPAYQGNREIPSVNLSHLFREEKFLRFNGRRRVSSFYQAAEKQQEDWAEDICRAGARGVPQTSTHLHPAFPSPDPGPNQEARLAFTWLRHILSRSLEMEPPEEKAVKVQTDKSSEIRPEPTLDLCEDQKPALGGNNNGDDPLEINTEAGGTQKDKRPVASTPVPGSPWCVVWTGDDRVFFFNPTMQLSVWEKPVDLKGRGDLSRIMKDPPHKRKKEESTGEESSSALIDDESVEQIIKRNKMEEPAVQSDQQKAEEELSAKISPGRTTLPLEVRISHFRDMLLERGVSAFSTWEKELYKIVFDPRYLLLSPDERKQIFEQFVKMRMKEEHKEKKSKQQQAKEEFRKLLEDSRITSRSTFKEFSEKYGRDQRFKRVPKKKDQEHLFSQFVSVLKKRDKENRLRLRKMR